MINYNKPYAIKSLISYRYKNNYGFIMVGARNTKDALNEINRSLSTGIAELSKLEIWDNDKYIGLEEQHD